VHVSFVSKGQEKDYCEELEKKKKLGDEIRM